MEVSPLLPDYALRLVIQNDTDVLLHANGVPILSHNFAGMVTDGEVGLGVRNSVSNFDNVQVGNYVPPPPPAALPVTEDFSDNVADYFEPRTVGWTVSNGAYQANASGGADALSTIRISGPLPSELDLRATISAEPDAGAQFSNALVIFDYQSNVDFKFAGAYVGANDWVIGHRTASWTTVASFADTIDASTDYALQLVIENDSSVTLNVNGVPKITHTFAGPLTDGEVGLGTLNALAHFDDVLVQAYVAPPPPPSATLPLAEDFSDGIADFFQPQVGNWNVSGSRYHDVPSGDAVSTFEHQWNATNRPGATSHDQRRLGSR